MTLKDLPADARPREKLLARGPAALADAELLALLLRTGLPGQGVLGLAQSVLDVCGGLAGLLHIQPSDLASVRGLGPAKRAELAAVLEIARRAIAQRMSDRHALADVRHAREYVAMQLSALPYEVFVVLFLDARHRLIRSEEMFRGTLAQTQVHPREIVRRALELHAAAVILAHNHPSGVAEPSIADEQLTQHLKAALRLVDVQVLDHLVVAGPHVLSFADRGLV